MRLSGLKLAGFKSFVDPTQLPLPSNLSGIVGPNGCGKSNLIDAVRWVLGESSVKTLRGQDSEDVIFNGSRSRKPVSRAAVELVFDNSDGQIQGPFAAYSEIGVRRELTRDGGSQYYLNNRKCLKRDVTDLFLGTGLGGRNQYAIIEQGMVSRMIEAKPEDLRVWLEEASGITKYKDRRRDTETRMRQTRENLERLDDLRQELGKRLETLRRQAANAEKYRELRAEERVLRATILALRLDDLDGETGSQRASQAMLEQRLASAQQAHVDAEAAREQREDERRAAQDAFNEAQGEVFAAEAEVAQADQAMSHARQLRALKQQEVEQIERQLSDLANREQGEQRRATQLAADIAELEQRQEHAVEAEEQAREALAEAEDALAEMQGRWDDLQSRSEQPLLQAEGERVRVQAQQRSLQSLDDRLRRLSEERAGLDDAPLREAVERAEAQMHEAAEGLATAAEGLEGLDAELAALREQRSALDGRLHETRQRLQSARGQLSSLETLQQAALRQDDKAFRRWIEASGLADAPPVAGGIDIEKGWEGALEQVLGEWISAPLIGKPERLASLAGSPDAPESGARLAAGTPADTVAGGLSGPDGSFARLQAPAAVHDLLAGVRVVESIEVALRYLAELGPGESLLCRDGTWLARDWLRLPKRKDARGGVLVRAPQIAALKSEIEQLQAQLERDEAELAALRERQQAAEAERRQQAQRHEAARSAHAQALAQRQSQGVRLEQLGARIQRLDDDIASLTDDVGEQREVLAEAQATLVELEQQAERLRAERQTLQQQLGQQREQTARARSTLQQTTLAQSQLQVQLAGKTSALAAQRQALEDLAEARAHLGEDREQRSAAAADHDAPLEQLGLTLDDARNRLEGRRDRLRRQRLQIETADSAFAESQQAQRMTEQVRDAARDALQQALLAAENLRTRRETLHEQFATALAEAELDEAALRAGIETPDLVACEDRLAQLLRRIERLGAINLAAIEELREADERAQYLDAQHADLTGALEALESAIRKIDGETRERFKDTFDRVNDVFKARFPKLFGGGEAWLELTDDNLLDAGVRVIARPPGKRNSSIHMLSGGEKAMTAVALLLGLFQLNPAPFCLMDEVDAPLDDANVTRFCEVIREMSANVQFIIITHNKITMELATHLLGVTMQEPGVSRLVSVDVQQAVDLAGAAPTTEQVTA